jgi:hypothetical protein
VSNCLRSVDSKQTREPGFHHFDAETGEGVDNDASALEHGRKSQLPSSPVL